MLKEMAGRAESWSTERVGLRLWWRKLLDSFSKIGGKTSIIRKTDVEKICDSQPISHHNNAKLKFQVKAHQVLHPL